MSGFETAIAAALAAQPQQRLLLLFVRAVPAEPHAAYHFAGARLQPLVSLDKVLTKELCFAELAAEADSIDDRWDFVLIAGLSKHDGSLPSSREAQDRLHQRTEAALVDGDFSRFLALDRNERPLVLRAERRLH